MIRIINVSADTLLLRCWYTYATEQWYSTDTVLWVYHNLTTDTLPIRYRYTTDTLLIRYWYTTDTNQWYRDIHGISISHVLVHQNYNGKIKGKGKVYRKKWRSLRTRAHGVVSLAWLRSVVHACLPKAVEHMEQQQRYSQDTLRDAYRRVLWVYHTCVFPARWVTDGYDTVSLPYHICITKSWRTYLPDCKWVDWNTVSYAYHHHEHCIISVS